MRTKMLAIATGALPEGATIVDNISVPEPKQVLLNVRFAEVARSAMEELGVNVVRMDPAAPRSINEFSSGSGNPTDVSDAIVAAVEADPGSRPLRVAVGDDGDPVRALNDQATAHQAAFLAQVGLTPEGQPANA